MRRIIIVAITIITALQTGCSHITMLRTAELRAVRSHVDSLKTELGDVQKQLLAEQKQQSEMLRLIRADQQVRFGELERTISSLAGNISESQYQLLQINEKTREIKQAWEERARSDSLRIAAKEAEIENLFEIAHGDFVAGRHEVAVNGFKDILERFPESKKADESAYWIAESYYVQKQYDAAEKQYLDYIKTYTEGEKICTALFKLGLIYESKKKQKAKDMVWQKALEQCPDSEEATAVKARTGQ